MYGRSGRYKEWFSKLNAVCIHTIAPQTAVFGTLQGGNRYSFRDTYLLMFVNKFMSLKQFDAPVVLFLVRMSDRKESFLHKHCSRMSSPVQSKSDQLYSAHK